MGRMEGIALTLALFQGERGLKERDLLWAVVCFCGYE